MEKEANKLDVSLISMYLKFEVYGLLLYAICDFLGEYLYAWFRLLDSLDSCYFFPIFVFGLLTLILVIGVVYDDTKLSLFLAAKRMDLIIHIISGFLISSQVFGEQINGFFMRVGNYLNEEKIILIIPIIFSSSYLLRKYMSKTNDKVIFENGSFLIDAECLSKNEDQLEFLHKAENFAESIYNYRSKNGLVFGIDSPWGTGKTSFVNICKQYWRENKSNQMIVYSFNPMRYEHSEKLFYKFIEGLIDEIGRYIYTPELNSYIWKYANRLNGSKAYFDYKGISLGMLLNCDSVDEIIKRLESLLMNIDRKIVIVIDDLDRLYPNTIKEILFVVMKAFSLPNISFVICYDTEKMNAIEINDIYSGNISQYLEKFINVKTTISLDKGALQNYFSKYTEKTRNENFLIDPKMISRSIGGLEQIFNSDKYYMYVRYVGDVRKIKRLINTIVMLDIQNTDFDQMDFDSRDLLHLILIYINYPSIFRMICNTELKGSRGFFSCITSHDEKYVEGSSVTIGEREYYNSSSYLNYARGLTDSQRFLVDQVFDIGERFKYYRDELKKIHYSNEVRAVFACFNGSKLSDKGRNLERYLNLIINMRKPVITDQYRFFKGYRDRICNGELIEIIISEIESFNDEKIHDEFWRTIVNASPETYDGINVLDILGAGLKLLPSYSYLSVSDKITGYIEDFIFIIVEILNIYGYKENKYTEISDMVLGENGDENYNVFNSMLKNRNVILGIYNLLVLRNYCCGNRNFDISIVTQSLIKNEKTIIDNEYVVKENAKLLIKSKLIITIEEYEKFPKKFIMYFTRNL